MSKHGSGNQFVARGNRRRDTITPAETVATEEISRRRRENIEQRGGVAAAFGQVLNPLANFARETDRGLLGRIGNMFSGTATGVADLLGGAGELFQEGASAFEQSGLEGIGVPGGQEGLGPMHLSQGTLEALVGDIPAPEELGSADDLAVEEAELQTELAVGAEKINLLTQADRTTMPFLVQQKRDAEIELAEIELERIAKELEDVVNLKAAYAESFDNSQRIFERHGVPGTVEDLKSDPKLAKVYDAINEAQLNDGEGLDAALDMLDNLTAEQRQDFGSGVRGEIFQDEINSAIKISMYNLVENRQQVRESIIDSKDWAREEALAQANDPWSTFTDPSAEGRGGDVVIGLMEQVIEGQFQGTLKTFQGIRAEEVLMGIWQTLPSQLREDEEGDEVREAYLTEVHVNDLSAFLRDELRMTVGQIEIVVEEMRGAIIRANEEVEKATNWADTLVFEPGGVALRTGLATVLLEVYQNEDEAEQMGRSVYLAEIINTRSGGKVTNYDPEANGNQFGLGNLPMHTYEALGYSAEMLEDNPEAQLEALVRFIEKKYGPNYEGLQVAWSDFAHNPDEWGELK